MFPHKRRLNGRFRVHETAKRTSLLFQSVLTSVWRLFPVPLSLPNSFPLLSSSTSSPFVLSLFLFLSFFLSFLFSLSFSFFSFFHLHGYHPNSRRSRSESREQWSFELIWEVIGRFFFFFFFPFFFGEKHWKKVAEHQSSKLLSGFFLFFNSSSLKVAFVACHRGLNVVR